MKKIEYDFESECQRKNELKMSGFLRMPQAAGGGCAVPNSQEEVSLHTSFIISTIYIFSCLASHSYYLSEFICVSFRFLHCSVLMPVPMCQCTMC